MHIAPANPDRIWTQTHTGVFRSDDAGASWRDVTEGLPSFHGFGLGVGKSPDTAYTVPIAYAGFYDNFRVATDSSPSGGRTMAARRGRRAPMVCLARTTTRASTAKGSTPTDSTARACTSARRTAPCTRASTAATAGRACRARCRPSCPSTAARTMMF